MIVIINTKRRSRVWVTCTVEIKWLKYFSKDFRWRFGKRNQSRIDYSHAYCHRTLRYWSIYSINQVGHLKDTVKSHHNFLIKCLRLLTIVVMSSILDAWQDSEFASDFGTTQNLHYFFVLVYKKKWKLFFTFAENVNMSQFTTSGSFCTFSKKKHFEFRITFNSFLLFLRFIQSPINDHVMWKIDRWLTPKILKIFVRG